MNSYEATQALAGFGGSLAIINLILMFMTPLFILLILIGVSSMQKNIKKISENLETLLELEAKKSVNAQPRIIDRELP